MQVIDMIKGYIGQLVVGILAVLVTYLVFLPWYDKKKIKNEIDSDFHQADHLLKTRQFKEAIGKYNKVLELSYNKFFDKYALAQGNLGNAYCALAEVRDKEVNVQNAINAINAYQKVLEVYIIEKCPVNYAIAQGNLWSAYVFLAEVRDKEVNVQNAINAFNKALEIHTVEKYPVSYARTQRNLEIAKKLSLRAGNFYLITILLLSTSSL
jgi:tetratricopeptide (TPR) repeat protein